MATLFAICWFPWFSIMLLYTLNYKSQSLSTLSHVFVLVRYITSIVSTFLYSFLRPNFYGALKKAANEGGKILLELKRFLYHSNPVEEGTSPMRSK